MLKAHSGLLLRMDLEVSRSRRGSRPSRYYNWSELMSRVCEIDLLERPSCKAGQMRILSAIHPPTTTQAILKSQGLPDGLYQGRTAPCTRDRGTAVEIRLAWGTCWGSMGRFRSPR